MIEDKLKQFDEKFDLDYKPYGNKSEEERVDMYNTLKDEYKDFIRTALKEHGEEVVIDELEKCLKDISDYKVPTGFGSASGGIGISAVIDYLKQRIKDLKTNESTSKGGQ